ncbi:MAG TPA: hypothetical protein PKZ03_05055 [Methanothrix sp.]|nr:hypothetical protein [Methanothrix sp.]
MDSGQILRARSALISRRKVHKIFDYDLGGVKSGWRRKKDENGGIPRRDQNLQSAKGSGREFKRNAMDEEEGVQD